MAKETTKQQPPEKPRASRRAMPWSIKGVSPAAREAARNAVGTSGRTMGDWLGEAIRTVAAEERGVAEMPPEPAEAIAPELPEPLAERIAAAERRTALMVAPLHELLETIARRLEGLESRLPAPPALSGTPDAGPSHVGTPRSGDDPEPDPESNAASSPPSADRS